MTRNTIWLKLSTFLLIWLTKRVPSLRGRLEQFVLRRAVRAAYRSFSYQHPRWADSLFDEYFLTYEAGYLLSRYIQAANPPTPIDLAVIWFDQLPYGSKLRQCRLTDAVSIATDFLNYLEAELQNYHRPWQNLAALVYI